MHALHLTECQSYYLYSVHFLQIGGGGINVRVFTPSCLRRYRHRRIICKRLAEIAPISCSSQLLDRRVPELYFLGTCSTKDIGRNRMSAVAGVMERKHARLGGADNKFDG